MKRYWVNYYFGLPEQRAEYELLKKTQPTWIEIYLATEVDAERAKDKDEIARLRKALDLKRDMIQFIYDSIYEIAQKAIDREALEGEKDDENKIDIEPELPKPYMNLKIK